jgi:hypothetical protein
VRPYPLARSREAGYDIVRRVLAHGFHAHARQHRRRQDADRPIDGVDQSDVLFGKSAVGHRESMLTFIGPQLVAVRWKQWRIYLTDMHPTGIGPQRLTGTESANSAMGGDPKVYNIEMDFK